MWVLGRGGLRAAHRLRQPGEPDPRARGIAAEFAIRSASARAVGAAAAVPDRGVLLAIVGGTLGAALELRRPARDAGREPRASAGARIALDARCYCSRSPSRSSLGCFRQAPLRIAKAVSISLKEGGQRSTAGARTPHPGNSCGQVALAVVLVVAPGTLHASKLMTVDRLQCDACSVRCRSPWRPYSKPEQRIAFFDQLGDLLRQPNVSG